MSRAFRVGLFVVATLLVFAGALFLIGSKRYLFTRTYHLNAQFENVAGLMKGAEVRVGGLRQGTVKDIRLPREPGGKVLVGMQLEPSTRDVLKKDSVASIQAEGLVGDKYVEITFGSKEAPAVADNDTIASDPPLDMSDVIKKANALLDTSQGAVQNLTATAENMKSVTGKIDAGKGTVGALVNDRTLYSRVNQGVTAFQEDMEGLKHNFLVRGFFKNRGYENSAELTAHQVSRIPAGQPAQTFQVDAGKLFSKPDTAKLKRDKMLNDAGSYLEQHPFGEAVIVASAGLRGDTEKAKTLTEARSMVVRDYIVQHFKVDDSRVKTLGLGKTGEMGEEPALKILVYPQAAAVAKR